MTRYRIYLLAADGGFIDLIEMNCSDDEMALAQAAPYADQAPHLELWNGRRLVLRTGARATPGKGGPVPA